MIGYRRLAGLCHKMIHHRGSNTLLFYIYFFRYLGEIDGINAWRALSEDLPSNRTSVLHNIDDIYGNAALTMGDWKIVKGVRHIMKVFDVNTVNACEVICYMFSMLLFF